MPSLMIPFHSMSRAEYLLQLWLWYRQTSPLRVTVLSFCELFINCNLRFSNSYMHSTNSQSNILNCPPPYFVPRTISIFNSLIIKVRHVIAPHTYIHTYRTHLAICAAHMLYILSFSCCICFWNLKRYSRKTSLSLSKSLL